MRHTIDRLGGSRIREAANVGMGRDHTLFAKAHGVVLFQVKGEGGRRIVNVVPASA